MSTESTDLTPVGDSHTPYTGPQPDHTPGATRQQALNVESTCPICAADSIYLFHPDRYFHLDGSANWRCWVAIGRGEGAARTEPVVRIPGRRRATPGPRRARLDALIAETTRKDTR